MQRALAAAVIHPDPAIRVGDARTLRGRSLTLQAFRSLVMIWLVMHPGGGCGSERSQFGGGHQHHVASRSRLGVCVRPRGCAGRSCARGCSPIPHQRPPPEPRRRPASFLPDPTRRSDRARPLDVTRRLNVDGVRARTRGRAARVFVGMRLVIRFVPSFLSRRPSNHTDSLSYRA